MWVGRWQHVVALAIKDEKTFNVTQVFTLFTPRNFTRSYENKKIPEDTCLPVAWRAEKGVALDLLKIELFCVFWAVY